METFPIRSRPDFPPAPVGVAIQWPRQQPRYYAIGHQTGGNNSTPDEAMAALHEAWASGLPLLFHGGKFDLSVLYERLGLPELPWERIHDTMTLAFLNDPYARSLALKPLAADLLQMPPDERDDVANWLWDHRAQLLQAFGIKAHQPRSPKAGEWIAYAPGDVVAPYACGDVVRTTNLFNRLYPLVTEAGMGAAYDRERRLQPILMENERSGIRVEQDGLGLSIETVETWLRTRLNASGLSFDADRDVAQVLLNNGVVPAENWTYTASGHLSVKKDVLTPDMFTDPQVASALGYRNRLATTLNTFMLPWQTQASANAGRITTNWNSTRSPGSGTRTGRPSTSNHNFLNVAKEFEEADDGYRHPAFLPVSPLPNIRCHLLPDEGHVWLNRDQDTQEVRVFAHLECGDLQQAYIENPNLDPHEFVGRLLAELRGQEYERALHRGPSKALNFLGIYGGGAPAAAKRLKVSLAEGKRFKMTHAKALPGLLVVNRAIQRVVARGEPVVTVGGRRYYPEPDSVSKTTGRMQDNVYKLINVLCQGGAADIIKDTIIDWHGHPKRNARFLLSIYDENSISAPIDDAQRQMAILRDVMEQDRLSVPMRSSGKWGPSWGALEKFTEERLPWAV
jgi:DNA polymerase I-like protein with 3'-5' exonuclease and polymerase domains